MQARKYYRIFCLILSVCLAVGLAGYSPSVGYAAQVEPPPPPTEGAESSTSQPVTPAGLDVPPPPGATPGEMALPMLRPVTSTGPGVSNPPVEGQAAPPAQRPLTPAEEEAAEVRAGLAALEAARNQGPEAVAALLDTLRGRALDTAMDEILEAQEQIARSTPVLPRPRNAPSPAEEEAALQANLARDAANRAQALQVRDDPAEDRPPAGDQAPDTPNRPAADLTVGSAPCTYATIADAIAAAQAGDRLLIEGGVTFAEHLFINKSLTLQGGYSGCGSGLAAYTTIDGSNSGRVFEIYGGADVILENLNITNGNEAWGGGIRVSEDSDLYGTNLEIYNNTATSYGGGLRVWGARATFTDTNIYNNIAPLGAGVYGTLYNAVAPALNLPYYADVADNQALTGDGYGGGLYMAGSGTTLATVSLDDCSDIYSNDAFHGGGVYLVSTTLTIHGDCSEIQSNTAITNGGGVYAQYSTVNLDNQAELIYNTAGSGGGAYLDASEMWSDVAQIRSNTAGGSGGGVYAVNGSLLDMDLEVYTCLGPRCSRLAYNTATNGSGGGVYAVDSEVDLIQTFVENNTSTWGGAIYAWRDPSATIRAVYASNCLFARNYGAGADGIRLWAASGDTTRMTGNQTTLAYNPSGGGGVAIAMDGAGTLDLSLARSIVWGHATSIDPAGQNVTYSDIQGGYAGTGNLDADPLFVSVADANFHLQAGSPVIDQCPSGLSLDFDNQARPAGAAYDMGADEVAPRVGINGAACAYDNLQDAIDAASPGDTLQAAGDTFYEVVNIDKSLTLAGGYDFATCSVSGASDTSVDGSAGSGSTVDITAGEVTLRNLRITGGDGLGAGVDVRNLGTLVTLDNTDVTGNSGSNGAGIYVGPNTVVTLTNYSSLSSNNATADGGGARVWGRLTGGYYSYISYNTAPNGGGISVPSGGDLDLNGAVVYYNQATGASPDGRGGGILLEGGVATLTSNTQVLGNQAVNGAGIYVDAGTLDFSGIILGNIASGYGGGLYANGGVLTLNNAQVGDTYAGAPNQLSNSGNGAGLYLSGTHASLVNTVVASNTFPSTAGAWGYGGGLYLANNSVVTLTGSTVERHLAPSASSRGAGMYVWDSTVTLSNSQVLSNTSEGAGGGLRLWGDCTLTILSGSVLRNNQALGGEGGALATADGTATILVSDSTLQSNAASGDGGAIYLSDGTLNFTGGWIVYSNYASGNGGAVAIAAGSAGFHANGGTGYLFNNAAGGNGGALWVHSTGTLPLYATSNYPLLLAYNYTGGNGGGAYADNGALFDTYGRVQIIYNRAAGNGGAYYLSGSSRLWLDDYYDDKPEVLVNWAQNGGAVYAQNSPRVQCDGAEIGYDPSGNYTTSGPGGAFYLGGSAFTASNCTFYNNRAMTYGGAIAAYTSTLTIGAQYTTLATEQGEPDAAGRGTETLTPTACDPLSGQCSSFYGNIADSDNNGSGYGGALYLNGSALSMDHTYLHRNSAERGGAIHQEGTTPTAWISNTLFYSNTSTSGVGAGVRMWNGVLTATHTTFAHNGGSAVANAGGTAYVFNSLAWGNTDGFVGADASSICNIDQSGNVGASVDPEFIAPGAGEDYHLQGSSPAIDMCTTGLSPDLDHVTRHVGCGYDAGAYEYASTDPLTVVRAVGAGEYAFGGTGVRINFTNIGSLTEVTVTLAHTYPTLQGDPRPLPRQVEITGDATDFTANLTLCYADSEWTGEGIANETDLRLYRYTGVPTWTQYIPSAIDTTLNRITAATAEFSVWAIGAVGHEPTRVSLVSLHATGGRLPVAVLLVGALLAGACVWGIKRRKR